MLLIAAGLISVVRVAVQTKQLAGSDNYRDFAATGAWWVASWSWNNWRRRSCFCPAEGYIFTVEMRSLPVALFSDITISRSDSWQMFSRPWAIEQQFYRALRWPWKMTMPSPLMSSFAPGVRGPLGTSRSLNWENKHTSEKVYWRLWHIECIGLYTLTGVKWKLYFSFLVLEKK